MKKKVILGLLISSILLISLITSVSAVLTSFTLTAEPNQHYFIRLLDYNTNESLTDFEITLNNQGYGANYFNLEPKKLTVKLMLIENGRVSQTTFLNKEDYTAGKPIVIIAGAGSGNTEINTGTTNVNNLEEKNETPEEINSNTTETAEVTENTTETTATSNNEVDNQIQDTQIVGNVINTNPGILNKSKDVILKNKYYFITGFVILILILVIIMLYKKKIVKSDFLHEFSTGKKHRNLKLLRAQNRLKRDKMEIKMLKKAPRIEEIKRNMEREREELRKLRGLK